MPICASVYEVIHKGSSVKRIFVWRMCRDVTDLLESTVVDSRYWYQDCPEEAARSSSAGWAWWVPRYMDLECSLNSLRRRFGKDTSPVTLFSDTAYITFGGVGIPLSWQPKWLVSAFKTLTLNVSIEQPCRHLCGAEFNRIQRWRHCSRLSHICCSKKWHQLYFQWRTTHGHQLYVSVHPQFCVCHQLHPWACSAHVSDARYASQAFKEKKLSRMIRTRGIEKLMYLAQAKFLNFRMYIEVRSH